MTVKLISNDGMRNDNLIHSRAFDCILWSECWLTWFVCHFLSSPPPAPLGTGRGHHHLHLQLCNIMPSLCISQMSAC